MKLPKFNAVQHLNIPTTIETERLILQRLKYEEAEEIFYAYASKEEATRYVSWPTHQSIKDTRHFINFAVHAWQQGSDYSFSIRLQNSGRLIGGFGVVNEYGKIQIGYILSPTQWGKGLCTEACREMLSRLRNMKAVYRIGTFVDAENSSSIRVLQKCGMIQEAFLPKWFRFVNQQNQPKDCILFKLELD